MVIRTYSLFSNFSHINSIIPGEAAFQAFLMFKKKKKTLKTPDVSGGKAHTERFSSLMSCQSMRASVSVAAKVA